jgi:hypothetical protein
MPTPEPPQTRRVRVVFLAWLVASVLGIAGYDWHAYHDAIPGNTISAALWPLVDAHPHFFTASVIASATLLIGHFVLGWWRGKTPS